MAERGLYCSHCDRQTLHRQKEPNRILHFLISFFTCGLWLIAWFFVEIIESPMLCTVCGTQNHFGAKTKAKPAREPK